MASYPDIQSMQHITDKQIESHAGRGVILCNICDEPLSSHTFATHPVSQTFVNWMRSVGYPFEDQTADSSLASGTNWLCSVTGEFISLRALTQEGRDKVLFLNISLSDAPWHELQRVTLVRYQWPTSQTVHPISSLPARILQRLAPCTQNLSDTDFFIRKAIGWALREYAKTEPQWVLAYIREHRDDMSGLTAREATKHLEVWQKGLPKVTTRFPVRASKTRR